MLNLLLKNFDIYVYCNAILGRSEIKEAEHYTISKLGAEAESS